MTAASAGRWSRAPGAARAVLSAFDLILPQDAESESRLKALGAATGDHLNLKLIGDPLPCDPVEYGDLRAVVGHRQAILAASTHPGEELTIVHAARAAAPDALLILAPRHPERGEEIAEHVAAERIAVARRSEGGLPGPATQVYVADTLGELGLFLRLVDLVVMGGSFVPGVGGHNPLEPARLGVPILAGPHVFKAQALYADLQEVTAAIEAPDQEALTRHIRGLLANPAIIRRMGAAGQRFAAGQGAALDHALDLLAPLVAA
jgi:3-deoxy-D-manno-octulosonic-acid transferase